MSLSDVLIKTPQSERGGEVARRGLDFQSCWALSNMLEYELAGKNYVFIFEYHDDVLILDSDTDPKSAIFAQVKTSETNWAWARLRNTAKDRPISVLGKLYRHRQNFAGYSVELMFVTNAFFTFFDKSFVSFNASELSDEDISLMKEKVQDQIGFNIQDDDLGILTFSRSSLSLEDHLTHLKGMLYNFLEKRFGEDCQIQTTSLARTLTSICSEKSAPLKKSPNNLGELIEQKGFTSSELNQIIDTLQKSKLSEPDWETAKSIFIDINKNTIQLLRLKSVFSQIKIWLKSNQNVAVIYLKESERLFDYNLATSNLSHFINDTILTVDANNPEHALALKDDQKLCLVVYSVIKKVREVADS